jgi:hypothetical protein
MKGELAAARAQLAAATADLQREAGAGGEALQALQAELAAAVSELDKERGAASETRAKLEALQHEGLAAGARVQALSRARSRRLPRATAPLTPPARPPAPLCPQARRWPPRRSRPPPCRPPTSSWRRV